MKLSNDFPEQVGVQCKWGFSNFCNSRCHRKCRKFDAQGSKGFDEGAHNTLKKVLNLWNNPDCPPIAMSQLLKACMYYTKGVARGGLGLKACRKVGVQKDCGSQGSKNRKTIGKNRYSKHKIYIN